MMRYLVQRTFSGLSTEEDYQGIVEFFKDKDTSKYNLALAQSLETIRAKITWLEVSIFFLTVWDVDTDRMCSGRLRTSRIGCRSGRMKDNFHS